MFVRVTLDKIVTMCSKRESGWILKKELLISVIHMRNGVFYRKKVKADGQIWQNYMIS